MTDERLEAIRRRSAELYAAAGFLDQPDREVAFSAVDDLRYLLDRIEAHREVVEAARSVDAEYHSASQESRGNLNGLMGRLREALDNLEEQTDD